AGIPADVAIDLGDGFRRHTDVVLPSLLEELLDRARAPADGSAALRRVLARLRLDEFASLARDAAWIDDDLPGRSPHALAALPPRCGALATELAAARARVVPKGNQKNFFEQWEALGDALRRAAEPATRLPLALLDAEAERLASKSTAVPQAPDAAAAAAARARFAAAFDLMKVLRAGAAEMPGEVGGGGGVVGRGLAASFARSGYLPPDGALARSADLLARHSTIRQAEAARFDLLLVDEFQDTDPRQCEIVLWL